MLPSSSPQSRRRSRLLPGVVSVAAAASILVGAAPAHAADPSIKVSTPAAGDVSGKVVFAAEAANARPSNVDFLVDGVKKWDEGSAPYRFNGDAGYLVEVPSSARALAVCAALAASGLPVTARPGLRSVLVEPAPGARPPTAAQVRHVVGTAGAAAEPVPGRRHEIAVRYDGEDLDEVARRTGLSVADVVARHLAPLYTVACLGFSRGFPYLEGLDPALRLPRRDVPRPRVPAGSVAIAADQTGIYPRGTPGGWHLLGTTDAVLFDETAEPPALLAPGDRVRFVAS